MIWVKDQSVFCVVGWLHPVLIIQSVKFQLRFIVTKMVAFASFLYSSILANVV